ncbi:unnamed protein product, partial [Symbiodinium necroappetens]
MYSSSLMLERRIAFQGDVADVRLISISLLLSLRVFLMSATAAGGHRWERGAPLVEKAQLLHCTIVPWMHKHWCREGREVFRAGSCLFLSLSGGGEGAVDTGIAIWLIGAAAISPSLGSSLISGRAGDEGEGGLGVSGASGDSTTTSSSELVYGSPGIDMHFTCAMQRRFLSSHAKSTETDWHVLESSSRGMGVSYPLGDLSDHRRSVHKSQVCSKNVHDPGWVLHLAVVSDFAKSLVLKWPSRIRADAVQLVPSCAVYGEPGSGGGGGALVLCDAFENVVGSIGTGNGGGAISAKGVVVDDGVAVDEAGMTVADLQIPLLIPVPPRTIAKSSIPGDEFPRSVGEVLAHIEAGQAGWERLWPLTTSEKRAEEDELLVSGLGDWKQEELETGSSSLADTGTGSVLAPATETVPRLLVRPLVAVADDLALGVLLGGECWFEPSHAHSK